MVKSPVTLRKQDYIETVTDSLVHETVMLQSNRSYDRGFRNLLDLTEIRFAFSPLTSHVGKLERERGYIIIRPALMPTNTTLPKGGWAWMGVDHIINGIPLCCRELTVTMASL